jgi:predicted nucleic acid-binding protein
MATTDEQSADSRLAALRCDPNVIGRERTNHGPLEPAFEVTEPVDILEFMGRQDDCEESPDSVELPVGSALWDDSIETMARWQLGSNDALHVATARAYGIRYFATTDRGFRGVPAPMIWLIRDDVSSPLGGGH